jgi:hypothetical protein
VAVGGTNVVRSTDGVTWTPSVSATATNLSVVTFGKDLFVGAGLHGTIQTSTNGDVWTMRTNGTTRALLGITYGNGRFVIVGNAGVMLASDDGITWTSVNLGLIDILRGVAFAVGTFVAVGDASLATGFSTILTSPDGLVWTNRTSSSVQNLWGAAYGHGAFVVVGEQASILQSAASIEVSLTAKGFGTSGFELLAAGESGARYRLQASTNLNAAGWVDLTAFTNDQPAISLIDTTAVSFPRRFYRLVSP